MLGYNKTEHIIKYRILTITQFHLKIIMIIKKASCSRKLQSHITFKPKQLDNIRYTSQCLKMKIEFLKKIEIIYVQSTFLESTIKTVASGFALMTTNIFEYRSTKKTII